MEDKSKDIKPNEVTGEAKWEHIVCDQKFTPVPKNYFVNGKGEIFVPHYIFFGDECDIIFIDI